MRQKNSRLPAQITTTLVKIVDRIQQNLVETDFQEEVHSSNFINVLGNICLFHVADTIETDTSPYAVDPNKKNGSNKHQPPTSSPWSALSQQKLDKQQELDKQQKLGELVELVHQLLQIIYYYKTLIDGQQIIKTMTKSKLLPHLKEHYTGSYPTDSAMQLELELLQFYTTPPHPPKRLPLLTQPTPGQKKDFIDKFSTPKNPKPRPDMSEYDALNIIAILEADQNIGYLSLSPQHRSHLLYRIYQYPECLQVILNIFNKSLQLNLTDPSALLNIRLLVARAQDSQKVTGLHAETIIQILFNPKLFLNVQTKNQHDCPLDEASTEGKRMFLMSNSKVQALIQARVAQSPGKGTPPLDKANILQIVAIYFQNIKQALLAQPTSSSSSAPNSISATKLPILAVGSAELTFLWDLYTRTKEGETSRNNSVSAETPLSPNFSSYHLDVVKLIGEIIDADLIHNIFQDFQHLSEKKNCNIMELCASITLLNYILLTLNAKSCYSLVQRFIIFPVKATAPKDADDSPTIYSERIQSLIVAFNNRIISLCCEHARGMNDAEVGQALKKSQAPFALPEITKQTLQLPPNHQARLLSQYTLFARITASLHLHHGDEWTENLTRVQKGIKRYWRQVCALGPNTRFLSSLIPTATDGKINSEYLPPLLTSFLGMDTNDSECQLSPSEKYVDVSTIINSIADCLSQIEQSMHSLVNNKSDDELESENEGNSDDESESNSASDSAAESEGNQHLPTKINNTATLDGTLERLSHVMNPDHLIFSFVPFYDAPEMSQNAVECIGHSIVAISSDLVQLIIKKQWHSSTIIADTDQQQLLHAVDILRYLIDVIANNHSIFQDIGGISSLAPHLHTVLLTIFTQHTNQKTSITDKLNKSCELYFNGTSATTLTHRTYSSWEGALNLALPEPFDSELLDNIIYDKFNQRWFTILDFIVQSSKDKFFGPNMLLHGLGAAFAESEDGGSIPEKPDVLDVFARLAEKHQHRGLCQFSPEKIIMAIERISTTLPDPDAESSILIAKNSCLLSLSKLLITRCQISLQCNQASNRDVTPASEVQFSFNWQAWQKLLNYVDPTTQPDLFNHFLICISSLIRCLNLTRQPEAPAAPQDSADQAPLLSKLCQYLSNLLNQASFSSTNTATLFAAPSHRADSDDFFITLNHLLRLIFLVMQRSPMPQTSGENTSILKFPKLIQCLLPKLIACQESTTQHSSEFFVMALNLLDRQFHKMLSCSPNDWLKNHLQAATKLHDLLQCFIGKVNENGAATAPGAKPQGYSLASAKKFALLLDGHIAPHKKQIKPNHFDTVRSGTVETVQATPLSASTANGGSSKKRSQPSPSRPNLSATAPTPDMPPEKTARSSETDLSPR